MPSGGYSHGRCCKCGGQFKHSKGGTAARRCVNCGHKRCSKCSK